MTQHEESSAPCPICGATELVEFSGRPAARCPGCGALERHRKLARAYAHLLADGNGRQALEIGPLSPWVFGRHLRDRGWRYTGADRWRRGNPVDPRDVSFIDLELDLCDLSPFADGAVHLVLVQHVIEEIPEYRTAFAEIARVLAADGVGLLEIPFDPLRPRSERQELDGFGNVWRFGADLPDVARRHFAEVDVLSYLEGRHRGQLLICRGAAPPAT
jgi:SAM-dependent methyltransferase